MSNEITRYCEVKDCTRKHHTYTEKLGPRIGLCSGHYDQLCKRGYIAVRLGAKPTNRPYGVQECEVDGCTLIPRASSNVNGTMMFLCSSHRHRWENFRDLDAVHEPYAFTPPGKRAKQRNRRGKRTVTQS